MAITVSNQECGGADSKKVRVRATIVAVACLGAIGVSAYLSPDPRGFGTHEQLGLPPCISTKFAGAPCPLCGMTTAFSLMAHARPFDAFCAQPAGAALFGICVLTFAGASTAAVLGYTPAHVAAFARARRLGSVTLMLLLGAWAYKLVTFWR